MPTTDWFADARAAVPRDNDDQISALYELGVTRGRRAPFPVNPVTPSQCSWSRTYIYAIIDSDPSAEGFQRLRNPQGASIVSTLPLTLR